MQKRLKNALSADNLVKIVYDSCVQVEDDTTKIQPKIKLPDYLMSAFAIFKLKYPSLLKFDKDCQDPAHAHNLKTLFHIDQAPSDTSLRERLDELSPDKLRPLFKKLFAQAQRHKVLESYTYLNGRYLVSIDGTGFFSSKSVHCDNCCEKNHKDGTTTYYHQMLCSVLIHPDQSNVIPLCPEPIQKQDGEKKNDCERNAAKRLLKDLKREHPHLKLIIVEDSLASNAPHIRLLEELSYQYILGAKPTDHKWLFEWVAASQCNQYEYMDENGNVHQFSYLNDVPLNESNEDVRVNFIEYWETRPNGKKLHFTWVTNILLSDKNIMKVMRGGRARWKVENETINTLKTQGYHFEHNFGHGNKNLCQVLAMLMMLAFLTDELQFIACRLMQLAKEKWHSKTSLWHKIRAAFDFYLILSWEDLLKVIAFGKQRPVLIPDTT